MGGQTLRMPAGAGSGFLDLASSHQDREVIQHFQGPKED